jgi:CheY-like chemotaxis protein
MPRIMVVDDDPDIRAGLTLALVDAGNEVVSAEDASSALVRMRERKPDLLLTDVIMPRIDGWALIGYCRADPRLADVPVLVMSGSVRMREIALQHDAIGFLLKPLEWETVVREVARALG